MHAAVQARASEPLRGPGGGQAGGCGAAPGEAVAGRLLAGGRAAGQRAYSGRAGRRAGAAAAAAGRGARARGAGARSALLWPQPMQPPLAAGLSTTEPWRESTQALKARSRSLCGRCSDLGCAVAWHLCRACPGHSRLPGSLPRRQAAETLLCLNSFDKPQERGQPPASAAATAPDADAAVALPASGQEAGAASVAEAVPRSASPLVELVKGMLQPPALQLRPQVRLPCPGKALEQCPSLPGRNMHPQRVSGARRHAQERPMRPVATSVRDRGGTCPFACRRWQRVGRAGP